MRPDQEIDAGFCILGTMEPPRQPISSDIIDPDFDDESNDEFGGADSFGMAPGCRRIIPEPRFDEYNPDDEPED